MACASVPAGLGQLCPCPRSLCSAARGLARARRSWGTMRQVMRVSDVRRRLAGDVLSLVCAKERIGVYV